MSYMVIWQPWIEKDLKPLGLNRERTIAKFAQGFVRPWTHVNELHGCGAFAASSFDVFCRGDWKKVLKQKTCDRNVKAYALYVKRIVTMKTDQEVGVEVKPKAGEKLKRKTRQKKTWSSKRSTSLATRKSPRKRRKR